MHIHVHNTQQPCHSSGTYSVASHLQTGFSLRIVHMEFFLNKVALGHVFLWTLMSSPVNKHSTNAPYLFIYHPRDEKWACQEPSSTETLSHPTMRINNTQCQHYGHSWVTDFKKKLPQILSNLQPIQAKKKLWASNSTHSRYFTICALHLARAPYRLQNIILTQNYLSRTCLNYTFCLFFSLQIIPPFVSDYLHVRDFSKPFFGKIAQAPHYTNLVGIQIMNLKKKIN